jgi:hypothetical protein
MPGRCLGDLIRVCSSRRPVSLDLERSRHRNGFTGYSGSLDDDAGGKVDDSTNLALLRDCKI